VLAYLGLGISLWPHAVPQHASEIEVFGMSGVI
jgi:hypothetical protein